VPDLQAGEAYAARALAPPGTASDREESTMGKLIGEILPFALGVALSPVPIIAVILMLFTPAARKNSLAFLAGWVFGLAAVCAIVMAVAGNLNYDTSSAASTGSSVLRLILGLLLIFGAFRQLKKRPGPGEEAQMPKWMGAIDKFKAPKSAGLAALLSGVNPKNLALTLAAALSVAQAKLATGESIAVLAVYVVLASITVAAPIFIYLVMGKKATRPLDSMKGWLSANNATVMFVLFLVFGMVLIGKGITGLS
jgi:hypothetical protein